MEKKLLIGLFAFFFLAVGTASAQTVSIFGVKQYNKTQGKPVNSTDYFKVPDGLENFVLSVQNGSGTKDDVKNFTISLNGQEVVNSRDMRKTNKISIPVNLLSENCLSVNMKGQGGDSLFVGIQGQVIPKKY